MKLKCDVKEQFILSVSEGESWSCYRRPGEEEEEEEEEVEVVREQKGKRDGGEEEEGEKRVGQVQSSVAGVKVLSVCPSVRSSHSFTPLFRNLITRLRTPSEPLPRTLYTPQCTPTSLTHHHNHLTLSLKS